MTYVRPVVVIGALYTAVIYGPGWLAFAACALVLLVLIREHGPKDPPLVRHTVTHLRRRQQDQVCDRQRVRR